MGSDGFEPPCGIPDLQSGAIDRSANSPRPAVCHRPRRLSSQRKHSSKSLSSRGDRSSRSSITAPCLNNPASFSPAASSSPTPTKRYGSRVSWWYSLSCTSDPFTDHESQPSWWRAADLNTDSVRKTTPVLTGSSVPQRHCVWEKHRVK